jgi:hypothetical protein
MAVANTDTGDLCGRSSQGFKGFVGGAYQGLFCTQTNFERLCKSDFFKEKYVGL